MTEYLDYKGHALKLVLVQIVSGKYQWEAMVDGRPVACLDGQPGSYDQMMSAARKAAERHVDRKAEATA